MENNNVMLLVPPYLRTLGYHFEPALLELSKRMIRETESRVDRYSFWDTWDGVLDYLNCVEYAREQLHNLPTGNQIGGYVILPARYHSVTLVFFAQATLDNVAVWLSERFQLPCRGSDCSFHKKKFSSSLTLADNSFSVVFDKHGSYIQELDNYRQEWIHRLAGGANVCADCAPPDPGFNPQIMVPINPAIDNPGMSDEKRMRMIDNCRKKNNGRWLYPIGEFADKIADSTKNIVLESIEISLRAFPNRDVRLLK